MLPAIPDRWQQRLESYLAEISSEPRTRLSASDFQHSVSIRFADGSYALFRHAFYLTSDELGEIVVFTEHCGYHVFPRYDTEVELLKSVCVERPLK